jgi:hypothetical protein
MKFLSPRLVMGATLFTTPGMKAAGGGGPAHFPILLTIVFVVVAVSVAVVLIQLNRNWRPDPQDPDPGDGWGRRPKDPRPDSPLGPHGGIPLDDAVPARVRLRGHGRLSEMLPARSRRPAREPGRRPVRTPVG